MKVTCKVKIRLAESEPSETVMVMLLIPTSELEGVPLNLPLDGSKAAQAGLPLIEKISVSPSGSLAAGVKEYACSAGITWVAGPVITGGWLTRGVLEGVGLAVRVALGSSVGYSGGAGLGWITTPVCVGAGVAEGAWLAVGSGRAVRVAASVGVNEGKAVGDWRG